ncbi:MAG: flagellar hook-basal body protein [Proteocatella sp.]
MNASFYTASVGAGMQQSKLDVIANNMANVNTQGYKSKSAVFSNLIYNNINEAQQSRSLKSGTGVKIQGTDIDSSWGSLNQTGNPLDYAIMGDGYFAVQNPQTEEIFYTRDGGFEMSQPADFDGETVNLVTKEGYYVLDSQEQPVELADSQEMLNIGVFKFPISNGMHSVQNGRFKPSEKNGVPESVDTEKRLERGSLEASNVDIAREMSKIIETQKAYQFSIKMIQTSDEVQGIVNSLR